MRRKAENTRASKIRNRAENTRALEFLDRYLEITIENARTVIGADLVWIWFSVFYAGPFYTGGPASEWWPRGAAFVRCDGAVSARYGARNGWRGERAVRCAERAVTYILNL